MQGVYHSVRVKKALRVYTSIAMKLKERSVVMGSIMIVMVKPMKIFPT